MNKESADTVASRLTGYVLAGGLSTRMGTDKSRLEIEGRSFLERAHRALSAVCGGRVKIVVNEKQLADFRALGRADELIADIYPARGALGGLHAAFEDCRTEFAVVLAVDLPFVTPAALEKLARLADSAGPAAAAVVPRQTDGRLQPLCAVYRVALCRDPLAARLAAGESLSVRRYLERLPVREIAETEIADDDHLFFNINRPDDLRAALREAETRGRRE
jgi:molybdenum cofactor guanylyltransferase